MDRCERYLAAPPERCVCCKGHSGRCKRPSDLKPGREWATERPRYRDALERIAEGHESAVIIARQALRE